MKGAPQILNACYTAGCMICVGGTSSTAVKFGETIGAFFMGIYIAAFEFIAYISICDAVIHVSQKEFVIAYELVAWIKVARRSNCYIFSANTAA